MTRFLAFVASYLVVVSLPLRVEGTGFVYNKDAYCDGAQVIIDSMTCDDSTTCEAGDMMRVQGTIGLQEELEYTYMCATTHACFQGFSEVCETYTSVIYDTCSALGLNMMMYGNGDSSCPSQGYYSMDAYFQVPSLSDMPVNSSKYDCA